MTIVEPGRRRLMPIIGIIGIATIPFLYAGALIWANVDPTHHLDQVPAAIVNLDSPATASGTTVRIGDDLTTKLTGDTSDSDFSWTETDAASAAAGLDDGRYLAVLTLPASLSADAAAGGSASTATASTITLTTNDAQSYIVGSISKTIAQTLQAEASSSVTKSYLDKVYLGFNSIHTSLTSAADGAGTVASGAKSLSSGAATLSSGAATLASGTVRLSSGASSLASGTASLSSGASSLASGTASLSSGASTLATGTTTLSSGAARLSSGTTTLSAGAATLSSGVSSYTAGVDKLAAGCAAAAADPDPYLAQICDGVAQLSPRSAALRTGAADTAAGAASAASGAKNVAAGAANAASGAKTLAAGASSAASGAKQLAAGAASAASGAKQLAAGAASAASGAKTLAAGAATAKSGAAKLAAGATTLSSKLADGAAKSPSYSASDREKLTDVLSQPVAVDTVHENAVASYGYGLTPYFTSLGLWVGGLAIYMLLPALPPSMIARHRPAWWIAIAGYLRGAAIAVVQTFAAFAIVTLAVGIHPANPWGLLGMMLLASAAFTAINHALMVLLGTPGRFVGLLLVVLQISSAAGTYPIQTTPGFFQAVHPWIPLTYSVEAFRSLIAGGSSGVLQAVWVLSAWLLGALAVAVGTTVLRRLRGAALLRPELSF